MAEPQRSEAMSPRPRRRRWRWICVGLLLVISVFILRGPLFAPLVKHVVTTQLAKAIAGNVVITEVSGGWFTDARIQGIEANGKPLGPLSHVYIKDLNATYGLGIFTGDSAALRSLTIDGLSLTLDLRAVENSAGAVPPLLAMLPSSLPSATVSGDIRFILPAGEVLLADSRLIMAANTIALDTMIHVAQAEPMHVQASFTRTSADTVRLDHVVKVGATSLEALELVLGVTRQDLNAVMDLGGGKLHLQVDSKQAQLTASNVEMSAIPSAFLALLPVQMGDLRGNITGEIKANHLATGWDVAGSLRADDLMAASVGPFGVVAQWQLGVGKAQVSQALVSGPGDGQLSIENLTIDFAARQFTSGVIHAQVPNIRAWLPVSVPLPSTSIAATAALAVNGDVLVITNAKLSGGGVEAQIHGNLVAGPWHIEAADIEVKTDLAQVMKWIPNAPKLSGNARARVTGKIPLSIDSTVFQRSELTAEIQSDACKIGSLAIDRLRVTAQTADGHLRFNMVEAITSNISMSASGVMEFTGQSGKATVDRLSIIFPGVTANLSEVFPLHFSAESWNAGPLRLISDAGDVVLEAQHREGFDRLHVEGHKLELNRLGFSDLGGSAEVDMVLSGAWTQPSAHVQVKASDVVIGKLHAQVALDFTQGERGMMIREGHIDAGADGRLAMSGTLPIIVGIGGLHVIPTGDLPATMDVYLPELNRWFPQAVAEGAAHLQLAIGLAQEPAVINGELTFEKLRLMVPKEAPEDPHSGRRHGIPLTINGMLGLHGDAAGMTATLQVNTDDRPIINGTLRSLGAWDAATLNGGWRDRSMVGEATLNGLNIGRFASLIPGIQHLAGQAEGNISLAGTWQQPVVGGNLKLSGVEAKIATDIPTLSDGSAELELIGNQIHVVRGVIDMGGALVTATGDIVFENKPQVNLRIEGTNALLMQRHDARLRASLDLLLKGPLDGLELSGKAVVTNALFSPDVSVWKNHGAGNDGRMVPFEFTDPPLSTTKFDVKVSSAFNDENDGVRLATTLVRADADLDLHLRGKGAAPELIGRVTVRKGKIFLPFSTLNMTNGEVLFPEGDPFHPRVNALANAQVRRYALTLQVDGPLADPQIRASGDGLDQRDALLLLTTGSTSSELTDENGQRAVIGRLGGWLGLEAWRMVEGPADPDTAPGILERMTVDFGRKISETGKDTIDAQVEITQPEECPSLLIYGERDRWDEYNAGIILRFRWGGDE